ncbi:hypothetical protein [Butyricimonas faecalis]|uniref:Uncharacterized protein n=1 Tax=Butyricimonas faecalis TaxID=2093856 RepID=A0A3Q9IR73_9BACT|nr:hypothetical protein [Butyricimonas faecalis]AZS28150.1 hypothetical protein D8S85_00360 [Butyricimonas faecalis]MBS7156911.1 hypothetical protein [Sanguibacteroides justesenii]
MKLRNKGIKTYLLSVAIVTFIAYIVPSIVLYLGGYGGVILSACISLLNVNIAVLAWILVKSNGKNALLKWHLGLNGCVVLLLLVIISLTITNGGFLSFSIIAFVWLGIFNILPIIFSYIVYSFILRKTCIKSTNM